MRLEGKVAIITGGARGIGAAIAGLFVREGARVIVADILEQEGQALARDLAGASGAARFFRLDVTDEAAWQGVIADTESAFGKLDILVSNAGILRMERVTAEELEGWELVQRVNSTGAFLGAKHAIPAMRRAGGGAIVNISSVAGLVGFGMAAAYVASKGALRLLTKAIAIQYAADGIRANSVHPGVIETEMVRPLLEQEQSRAALVAAHPLGRAGQPDDVAYGVLYLASDEASFVTGAELVIDGGYTAQ